MTTRTRGPARPPRFRAVGSLGVALLVPLTLAIPALGCTPPETTASEPQRLCKLDSDCGGGRYCTVSGVCRRDCVLDVHCHGPTTSAQCNTQGKCIDTVDAASPPLDDADPMETGDDAPAGDAEPDVEPDLGLDPPDGGGGA